MLRCVCIAFSIIGVLLGGRVPLATAQALRSASLTGAVVDQTGAAIPNASITIRQETASVEQRMKADAQGAFAVGNLRPGDYEISATSIGFTVGVERLALRAGESRRVQLTLQVGNLSEDVQVLAREVAGSHERLRRLPGSVDVLEAGTLERSHVFTTNEALRKIAGLHVRDEEGFGLRPNIGIRGLNPTRSSKVLLLEDGIPLTYAPYGDNA